MNSVLRQVFKARRYHSTRFGYADDTTVCAMREPGLQCVVNVKVIVWADVVRDGTNILGCRNTIISAAMYYSHTNFFYDDGCSGVVRNASLETLTLGVICQISEQGERPMYRLFLAFFPFECMRN